MRFSAFATLALAGCLVAATAHADLVGSPASPPTLSDRQRDLLAANPDLAHLQDASPWMLARVLGDFQSSGVEDQPREEPRQPIDPLKVPDPADRQMLKANPDLRELWRTTPDPALALLRLIRAARETPPRN